MFRMKAWALAAGANYAGLPNPKKPASEIDLVWPHWKEGQIKGSCNP